LAGANIPFGVASQFLRALFSLKGALARRTPQWGPGIGPAARLPSAGKPHLKKNMKKQ
jgi:hypothetical protein